MPMPKRAVIGEPTGFEIINTHKGVAQFKLNIKGLAGHSSRPDLGHNAIVATHQIIKTVSDLNEKLMQEAPTGMRKDFPDFPFNYLHLATINGGQAANMIPDLCEMVFSYRLFPGEEERQLYNEFKSLITKLNLGLEVEFEFVYDTPAMPCAHEPELESLLKDITKQDLRSVSFATDGGYFSKLGIETFVCGAGQIAQAHMPDEYISVKDFLAGTDYVKNIVRKLLF
jgi:acetylornithine deacetylase